MNRESMQRGVKARKVREDRPLKLVKECLQYTEKQYNQTKLQIEKLKTRRALLHRRARKLEQMVRRQEKRERSSATRRRSKLTQNNNENEIPSCSSQSRNNRYTQPQPSGLRGSNGNPFRRPLVSNSILPEWLRRRSPNKKVLKLASKMYAFDTSPNTIKELKKVKAKVLSR